MNISILSFLLLIEILLTILLFKNWTSATFWITGMFLLASLSYWAYIDYFVSDIQFKTLFLIQGAVLFSLFGEIMGMHIKFVGLQRKQNFGYTPFAPDMKPLIASSLIIFVEVIFILGLGAYRFYDMYIFTKKIGNSSLLNTVYYIRPYFTSGEYSINRYVGILTSISEGMAYVSLYYFFYNFILFKIRKIRLMLPFISYLILLISTTGRTGYIRAFIILIGIVYILLVKSGLSKNIISFRMFKYVIKAIILLLTFFFLYGAWVRKSDRTFIKYFADYFATGIVGLDYYIRKPWPSNDIFGQYTLNNIYYFLNKFGASFVIPEHHLQFFTWENGKSNIYTALVLPLQDYGIMGMLLTRSLLTFIYIRLRNSTLNQKQSTKIVIPTIVFGYYLYIFFSFPIADRFIEFITIISFPMFIISLYFADYIFKRSVKKSVKFQI